MTASQPAVPDELVERLLRLLADVAAKATPYGEQDGGFVATYILPTGPIHRILAVLGEHGWSVPLSPQESPPVDRETALRVLSIYNRMSNTPVEGMMRALAAIADDLRAEARRQCAAELRERLSTRTGPIDLGPRLFDLADSWEVK